MTKINHKNGFTLVELLVAIGIMATLMAIILPNFMGARERARDAQKIQDLGAMKTALRIYYNDVQAYPTGTGGMLSAGFSGYMPSASNLGYTYNYYQTDNGNGFIVCTGMEAGAGDEDINSQRKCGLETLPIGVCGLGVGRTGNNIYTSCAK